jgi:hypothetical protein
MSRTLLSSISILLVSLLGLRPAAAVELNYDELVHLDAEDLAETGMKHAYDALLPALKRYVATPATLDELIDPDVPSYRVRCQSVEYLIYDYSARNDAEVVSWGRATVAFFSIVNRQLAGTKYRFFAFNSGNDLGGMFLTVEQAEAARKSLPRRTD